jgi:hypothetical protein
MFDEMEEREEERGTGVGDKSMLLAETSNTS